MQEIVDRYSGRECGPWLPSCAWRGGRCVVPAAVPYAPGFGERAFEDGWRDGRVGDAVDNVCGAPFMGQHCPWAACASGVISEGMGHDSEATTRIYLASLEMSVVDEGEQ